MRKFNKSLLVLFLSFLFCFIATPENSIYAQKKGTKLRIGTYDSRVIVFAWSRSAYFKEKMGKFKMQSDSAEKANDSLKTKELSVYAMSFQHLLHQMVFSTGTVASIIEVVKDQLPELAKKEGVSLIVSKWEVNFVDPSVEITDLTSQVAQLFNPAENIAKMADEIVKAQPVPLDDLTIEEDMLNLYCKRFGTK
ncbi:MAG: hypothetical protein WCP55_22260, partial [Lentisphaerota bacterium]